MLSGSLTTILDEMAPIRTIQIREKYAPWLSLNTKQKMAERDQAQQKALQSKLAAEWKAYKLLTHNVNYIFRSEKRNWQHKKFQQCEEEHDTKQIWKM